MARTPFKLKSGNSTPFKELGSSPLQKKVVNPDGSVTRTRKNIFTGRTRVVTKGKGRNYDYVDGKKVQAGYLPDKKTVQVYDKKGNLIKEKRILKGKDTASHDMKVIGTKTKIKRVSKNDPDAKTAKFTKQINKGKGRKSVRKSDYEKGIVTRKYRTTSGEKGKEKTMIEPGSRGHTKGHTLHAFDI